MIPWPSSGCCKQSETILNVLKQQDKEIVFLKNQSGQMLNKLKSQEKEIQSQRETMNDILWCVSRPPPPPPQPVIPAAKESPMYITTKYDGHVQDPTKLE